MLPMTVMIFAFYIGAAFIDSSYVFTGLFVFLVTSVVGVIITSYIESTLKEFILKPRTAVPNPLQMHEPEPSPSGQPS